MLLALTERLEHEGFIQTDGTHLKLTPDGERVALHVVRAHRLWEVYLAEELGMPLDRVHVEAERQEHRLSRAAARSPVGVDGTPGRRSARRSRFPPRKERCPKRRAPPLSAWPMSTPARIVHLEDEPPLAYAQLTAEGLRLGQFVRVIERTPARIVLSDGENEYRLAPMLAANVHVAARCRTAAPPLDGVMPLTELPSGATADIVALDPVVSRLRPPPPARSRLHAGRAHSQRAGDVLPAIRARIGCAAPRSRCAANNPIACS